MSKSFISLEPMADNRTRLTYRGGPSQLIKLLSDAVVCNPEFRMIFFASAKVALDYMEMGGPAESIDLKQNPVHPSEN